MDETTHKSGYVAIIGKPNAGKSTLLNSLIGSRVSITTHKPQTTRHQILGIYTDEDSQIIFLDTPGVLTPRYELHHAMMRFVERARKDADLILLIVDASDPGNPQDLADLLESVQKPILLVINKIDQVSTAEVQSVAARIQDLLDIRSVHPISALTGQGVPELISDVKHHLLPGPSYYPEDMLSEQPVRFFASELIREQIFLQFHEEIPYSCTVEVIHYEERDDLDYISADIIVNQKSQKGMLIGKGGKAIRKLGTDSREVIEEFIGKKVFLELHVKVREKWRERKNWVKNLGYQ